MTAHRVSQLVEAGVWLQATGDRDGARRLFEQALKLDPTNVRALQLLGGSAPAAAPAPAVPTGTVAFGRSENPFARPPALDDLELEAPAPPAPGPLPYDPPPEVPGRQLAPAAPPRMRSGILQLSEVVSAPPAAPASTPTMLFAGSQLDAALSAPPPRPPPAQSAWEAGGARALKVDVSGPRDNDVFSLVAKAHTPPASQPARPPPGLDVGEEVRTLLHGAEDLIGLDDHSGALDLLNKALELQPGNADAEGLRQKAEGTLLAMYESKIGPLDARPQILLKQDEIIWLNLDHRAGFVLAQIDAQVTYDDLFAICGMTRLDTARILAQLLDERVIAA